MTWSRWNAPSRRYLPCLVLGLLALPGCAPFQTGMPSQPMPVPAPAAPAPDPSLGGEIARAAEALLGAPYRYGSSGPDTFDCSGLVSYVHRQFGVATPRTAAEQFAAARPIPKAELQAGDLVFFRLNGVAVSHVGIYIGSNEFVHAPQTGERVRVANLNDDYYRNRYAGGGRLYSR